MELYSALSMCINTSRMQLKGKQITRFELENYLTTKDSHFISNLIKTKALIKCKNGKYKFSDKPINILKIKYCWKRKHIN